MPTDSSELIGCPKKKKKKDQNMVASIVFLGWARHNSCIDYKRLHVVNCHIHSDVHKVHDIF